VQAVANGGPQQVDLAARQCRAEQGGPLDVVDRVGPDVGTRQESARLGGRQGEGRDDDDRVERRGRKADRRQTVGLVERGDDRAPVPGRERVVGMSFELGDRAGEDIVGGRLRRELRAERNPDRVGRRWRSP
jgi:hypothetical protein